MGAQTGTYPEQLTITNDLLIGDLILLCRDNKIFRINPSLIGGGGAIEEASLKIWQDQGEYDASSGYWPTPNHTIGEVPIKKGMLWRIGTEGYASGLDSIDVGLSLGDTVRALVDDAGQYASHWAVTEGNIGYTPEDANNREDIETGLSNSYYKYPSSGLLTDILSILGRTIENEITDTTYTIDPSDVTALGEVLVVLTNTDPIACTLDSPNTLGKLDGDKVTIVQGGTGVVTVTANLTSFKGAATTSTTAEFYWEGETKTFIATAGATAWRVIGG